MPGESEVGATLARIERKLDTTDTRLTGIDLAVHDLKREQVRFNELQKIANGRVTKLELQDGARQLREAHESGVDEGRGGMLLSKKQAAAALAVIGSVAGAASGIVTVILKVAA